MLQKAKSLIKDWAGLNDKGEEMLDSTPIAMPVGYKRPPSLQETIARMMQNERMRQEFMANGIETFEEAEDFDVGDDFDPTSPWEVEFDPVLGREVYKAQKAQLDAARGEFDGNVRKQRLSKAFVEEKPSQTRKKSKEKASTERDDAHASDED